jgi:hypothetical protein
MVLSNEVITALIGASVGVTIAVIQAVLGYLERKRSKRDSYLFQAFQYFDGGTQRRNIGVAIIEGLWQEAPHLQGLFVPLLVNQAIYLLLGSEQSEAPNEQDNLRRIMGLVTTPAGPSKGFAGHYRELLRAIKDKKAGPTRAGVNVDGKNLDEWAERLTSRCT